MPVQKKMELSMLQIIIGIVGLATMALIGGIGIGMRIAVPSPPPFVPTDLSGTYGWQWAGENWFGKITLSEHNTITQGRVGYMRKSYAQDGSAQFEMEHEIMHLVSGTYTLRGDSSVNIDMLVKKKVKGDHPELEQRIVGTLEERRCLAGQVEYQDHLTGKRYPGDMILVKYCSHVGDGILTWCREPR